MSGLGVYTHSNCTTKTLHYTTLHFICYILWVSLSSIAHPTLPPHLSFFSPSNDSFKGPVFYYSSKKEAHITRHKAFCTHIHIHIHTYTHHTLPTQRSPSDTFLGGIYPLVLVALRVRIKERIAFECTHY